MRCVLQIHISGNGALENRRRRQNVTSWQQEWLPFTSFKTKNKNGSSVSGWHRQSMAKAQYGAGYGANSKHWFKTSFLRPLPYLVSYVIGSRKLSANEQFFVGAQTVVSLLQTTQIISDVCFLTNHVAYANSYKTKIVWIVTELFFYPGWIRLMFTCVLGH